VIITIPVAKLARLPTVTDQNFSSDEITKASEDQVAASIAGRCEAFRANSSAIVLLSLHLLSSSQRYNSPIANFPVSTSKQQSTQVNISSMPIDWKDPSMTDRLLAALLAASGGKVVQSFSSMKYPAMLTSIHRLIIRKLHTTLAMILHTTLFTVDFAKPSTSQSV